MRFARKQYAIFHALLTLLFNVFYVAHSGEKMGYSYGGTQYGTAGGGAGYYQQGGPHSSNYGGFSVQQRGGIPFQHAMAHQHEYAQHNRKYYDDDIPMALPNSWFGYWQESGVNSHFGLPNAYAAPDWFLPLPSEFSSGKAAREYYIEPLRPECPQQYGMVKSGSARVNNQRTVYKYYMQKHAYTTRAQQAKHYYGMMGSDVTACIYPPPGVHFIKLNINGEEHHFAPNGKSISAAAYNLVWEKRRQEQHQQPVPQHYQRMPYGHFVPPPNNVHNPGYGPPQPTYPQAYYLHQAYQPYQW